MRSIETHVTPAQTLVGLTRTGVNPAQTVVILTRTGMIRPRGGQCVGATVPLC